MEDELKPQSLSDQELLARLRDFGDNNYKSVTSKNRQILEKKLNHYVAARRKKEREELERSKTKISRGRPSIKKSHINVAVAKIKEDATEFSDSDLDRSPSRSRRSSRRQSAAVNTSYSLDETVSDVRKSPTVLASSRKEIDTRQRQSFGAYSRYNLDEATYGSSEIDSYVQPRPAHRYSPESNKEAPRRTVFNRSNDVSVSEVETRHLEIRPKKTQPIVSASKRSIDDRIDRRHTVYSRSQQNAGNSYPQTRTVERFLRWCQSLWKINQSPQRTRGFSSSEPNGSSGFKWFQPVTFLCLLVILASIAVAVYYRKACVGEHCATLIKMEDRLKTLSKVAAVTYGNYLCGYASSGDLAIDDMTFDSAPLKVLQFAVENREANLTFKLLDADDHAVSDVSRAAKVRSLVPVKSLWCRVRQSFAAVTQALLYLLLGIFGLIGLAITVKLYLHEQKKEAKRVQELVNGIIGIVKKQSLKHPAFIPISHVRDTLLTPDEKKGKGQLGSRRWEKAVRYLRLNESRLRTENQIIKGEEYVVWRWVSLHPSLLGSKERRSPTIEKSGNVPSGSGGLISSSEPESLEVERKVTTLRPQSPRQTTARTHLRTTVYESTDSTSTTTAEVRPRSRSDSRGRKSISLGPCTGWSNYARSCVEIVPPTQCLKLKNLALENTGNAGLDIAKDAVITRLTSFGFHVYSVDFDHKSEETAVYICCTNKEQAADVYRVFYEQKYNGEVVQVKFLTLEKYLERFPYLRPVLSYAA